MGIPKFFRYISERWPMISQLIDATQVPEFDNLYLDMNSILHTCTHSNDDDVTKRLSEEEVFSKIFTYIDHLFHIIKPKKVFYMAIDGVAPRAKMNQQRARRFRAAMDFEKSLEKAITRGMPIPKGEPFDSNCITPGTEFMAKLTRNLKYFIHNKISNDSSWQSVDIIFSGHEVPGEGEHKIMDYIRVSRSQPEYDPNTRHCIYGLDADLIMLGLSTHDPHFALLREDVVYGRHHKSKSLEQQHFFLLHLSMLREYLDLEFQEIASHLRFKYDFERILDDFILVMFVIGNDFLPNLPDLHLNKGAFPLLLATFKDALMNTDGYINKNGIINLRRLAIWSEYLSFFELENFEHGDVDIEWFNKQLEHVSLTGRRKRKRTGKKLLLKSEKQIVNTIKSWFVKVTSQNFDKECSENESCQFLELDKEVVLEHLNFVEGFISDLDISMTYSRSKSKYILEIIPKDNGSNDTEEAPNRYITDMRVFKKYDQAIVDDEYGLEQKFGIYNERLEQWKDKYYQDKLGFSYYDTDKLRDLTENYVEGLQWVLRYYYSGCPSWSWYYRYHYAPRISDIVKGLNQIIRFTKSRPFKPFQQLMAVLPERSKKLLPIAYRHLMYDKKSPIVHFYPHEVELDKNGKTADWEAVVKLSFVNESDLIEAMKPYNKKLTLEERERNQFGTNIIFSYNPQVDNIYKTPLSGIFSDIEHNHCVESNFVLKSCKIDEICYGLSKGVMLGLDTLAGFPILKSISFRFGLKYNKCLIFQQPSRQQSMVLTVRDVYNQSDFSLDEFAATYLNKVVYTKWPYLRESKLVSISNGEVTYKINEKHGDEYPNSDPIEIVPLSYSKKIEYKRLCKSMMEDYSKKQGIILTKVSCIVTVTPVTGLTRYRDGSYLKTFSGQEECYPLQLVVKDIRNKDTRYVERPPLSIDKEFPLHSKLIFLGDYAYGGEAMVDGYNSDSRLKLTVKKMSISEPEIGMKRARIDLNMLTYYPHSVAAKELQLHPSVLAKITSKLFITNSSSKKINIGLGIKSVKSRERALGYARYRVRCWEFSNLTLNLVNQYRELFPKIFDAFANNYQNDILTSADLFPGLDSQKANSLLVAASRWIETVRKSFVITSWESNSLTRASIAAIEDEIEVYSQRPISFVEKQLSKVPCEAVLDPKKSTSLLRSQKFDLGDRVIYIQRSGKVPLFSKGTVIGYITLGKSLSIQVVFDNEIVAGSTFEDRLRTKRGIGLDASFLLNITNKQFIYHSKASRKANKKFECKDRHSYVSSTKLNCKKNNAYELLNVIKNNKNSISPLEDGSNKQLPTPSSNSTPKNNAPIHVISEAHDKNVANNVYNAILNQFDGVQYQTDSSGLPYVLPFIPEATQSPLHTTRLSHVATQLPTSSNISYVLPHSSHLVCADKPLSGTSELLINKDKHGVAGRTFLPVKQNKNSPRGYSKRGKNVK